MEVRSQKGHETRFEIPPYPEDKFRGISCHQRKHSESSVSSLTSYGPATPSSAYSPCLSPIPTSNYPTSMSQEGDSPWGYSTESPMDGGSGYDYASYGYYGTVGESSSDAAAGYVNIPVPERGGSRIERQLTNTHRLQTTDGYCCLIPGCKAVPFKRNADLDRHYKHKHRDDERKDSYYCDYPKCSRRDSPFHRRDHFRDHLREYHKEDIAKRGRPVHTHWVESRNVKKEWWRCTRCLARVMVEQSGFECPACNTTCDVSRADTRKSKTP